MGKKALPVPRPPLHLLQVLQVPPPLLLGLLPIVGQGRWRLGQVHLQGSRQQVQEQLVQVLLRVLEVQLVLLLQEEGGPRWWSSTRRSIM